MKMSLFHSASTGMKVTGRRDSAAERASASMPTGISTSGTGPQMPAMAKAHAHMRMETSTLVSLAWPFCLHLAQSGIQPCQRRVSSV